MKQIAAIATLAFSATAYSMDALPPWPSDALNERDPRVVAYYQAQCARWATQAGRQGEDKATYTNWCLEQMPKLQPVGLIAASGGE